MFQIIGCVQLVLLILFLVFSLKKAGIITFVDNIKFMLILWMLAIIGYNLQISKLYNPTIEINIIVMALCAIFYLTSRRVCVNSEMATEFMDYKDPEYNYTIYSKIFNIVFILAIITFAVNIAYFGLAILDDQKIIGKQQMFHWSGYVVYMLVLCAEVKYITFREKRKIVDLLIVILSIGTLVLTLNRGPIAFILVTIAIYEFFNLVKLKKYVSKFRIYLTYALLIIAFYVFLYFFAHIGDIRMDFVLRHHYEMSLGEFYDAASYIPSIILWPYIYLTSPLENAAFSLAYQHIDFTYLNNLFYPFIKFFANIFGQGANYKDWLTSQTTYTPHLVNTVGLSVSSFLPQAMQDLGYVGVALYVGIYLLLAYFTIWLIRNKERFSKISIIVIYSNIFSILMWSVFENSLKIPVLILNILIVLFIEVLIKRGNLHFLTRKLIRFRRRRNG